MADVFTVTAVWQGFTGAPGYSKFRFQLLASQADYDLATTKVRNFFDAIKAYLSTGHSVTVQQGILINDSVGGTLTGQVLASTPPAAVNGTSATASWSAGAGAFVSWRTAAIFLGRRVQGRTFLVPLRGANDVDGTLLGAAQTTIKSSGDILIGGTNPPVIWAKQFAKNSEGKDQQVGGALAPITQTIVPDKTGILRSRRD